MTNLFTEDKTPGEWIEYFEQQLASGVTDPRIKAHLDSGGTLEIRDTLIGVEKTASFKMRGELHHENGPAFLEASRYGSAERWHKNGESHRTDGPSETHRDAGGNIISQSWFQDGVFSRAGDLPHFETRWLKAWFNANNEAHRIGGPAREESSGRTEWRQNDVLHREDGPALIQANGKEKFYFQGVRCKTKEELDRLVLAQVKTSTSEVKFTG